MNELIIYLNARASLSRTLSGQELEFKRDGIPFGDSHFGRPGFGRDRAHPPRGWFLIEGTTFQPSP